MSEKPTIKIDLKQKNGDRRVDCLALWHGKHPGQYNGKFAIYNPDTGERVDVVKLKLANGRAITLDEWWVNGMHWGEYNAAKGGAPSYNEAPPEPPIPFGDDDDDLPF